MLGPPPFPGDESFAHAVDVPIQGRAMTSLFRWQEPAIDKAINTKLQG
jgi:hypothetical protein